MSEIEKINFDKPVRGRIPHIKVLIFTSQSDNVQYYKKSKFNKKLDKNVILDVGVIYYHYIKYKDKIIPYASYTDGHNIYRIKYFDLINEFDDEKTFSEIYKKYQYERIPIHELIEMYML